MAQRSDTISLALVILPNIVLVSFRIFSPEFDDALSNDTTSELSIHLIALLIGIFIMYRYRFVEDHEYRRSKAIERLSGTYKKEDKGLWEKGELALQKLEARAFSDFRGRKASIARKKMQSSIGELNREAREVEHSEEQSDYSVLVSGVDQQTISSDQRQTAETSINRLSEFFKGFVERTASRRVDSRKKRELRLQKNKDSSLNDINSDSQWAIPSQSNKRSRARLCNSCSTYNYPDSNYCTSCGSFID
ncbi:MAG: hypothetical protein CMB67_01420 [Euryarchaeota archaeon]|nr:hypothetical protein [Euryarchaeota archaeon]